MSIFECKNLILLLMCCIFALFLAKLIAFFDISMPYPKLFFLSFKTDKIIHPDPVPMSKICFISFFLISFKTWSTNISVSGLGIKTDLLILKLFFQNSLKPNIYAIGSLFFLLFIKLKKISFWCFFILWFRLNNNLVVSNFRQ